MGIISLLSYRTCLLWTGWQRLFLWGLLQWRRRAGERGVQREHYETGLLTQTGITVHTYAGIQERQRWARGMLCLQHSTPLIYCADYMGWISMSKGHVLHRYISLFLSLLLCNIKKGGNLDEATLFIIIFGFTIWKYKSVKLSYH